MILLLSYLQGCRKEEGWGGGGGGGGGVGRF